MSSQMTGSAIAEAAGSKPSIKVKVLNRKRSSLLLRQSQRWTLIATPAGEPSEQESKTEVSIYKDDVTMTVPATGKYRVDLMVTSGGYTAGILPRTPAYDVIHRVLSWVAAKTKLPMPGIPFMVDSCDDVEAAAAIESPLELDSSGGTTPSRIARLSIAGIDALLAVLALVVYGWILLVAADLPVPPWLILIVGGAIALLSLYLALNSFLNAVNVIRDRSAAANGRSVPEADMSKIGIAEVAATVTSDAIVGLAMTWFLATTLAVVMFATQELGACLSAPGCRALTPQELAEGLLWHAADTVPLVDIVKTWSWETPLEIKSNPPLSVVAGIPPLLMRLVVALGLARLVAQIFDGRAS